MREYLSAALCAALGISILAWQAVSAGEISPTASDVLRCEPIFDGKTLNGWTTTDGKPVTQGWEVVDGTIHLNTTGPRGGNIVTVGEYANFDLRFEWKISPGGNSGIKYRVRNYGKSTLGCEYQIIDDEKSPDGKKPKSSTGSMYALYPPGANKYLKPVGQFNSSRVVVCGNQVQHWLNGHLIVSASIGSCEWFERKAQSKFKNIDGFSENRYGKIMLTDHHSEVWYRNIVLHELEEVEYRAKLIKRLQRFRPFAFLGRGRLMRRGR